MSGENRFETLALSAPIGIFEADAKGRCVYVNPAICRFTGMPETAHMGGGWSSAVHPDDRENISTLWQKMVAGKSPFEAEFRIVNSTEVVWVKSHAAPLKNGLGKTIGFIGTLIEITAQQKTAQRAAQLNRLNEELLGLERLTQKFGAITDSIVNIFHADFARIWMIQPGDVCSSCLHYDAEDAQHRCRDPKQCLHLMASSGRYDHIDGGHARVPFGCYKIGLIAAGTQNKFLTNDVVNDKRIHNNDWARRLNLKAFAGYRLMSSEGKVMGVMALFSKEQIGVHEDSQLETLAVTAGQMIDAERTKEALLQSEIKYKAMMESMVDPVHICSADHKIVYMNKAMIKRIGRDATGEICYKVLQNLQKPCDWCVFDRLEKDREIEKTIVSPLDNRTYRVTNMPVSNSDGSVAKMSIYKDITDYLEAVKEKEKVYKQLQQVRKLESIGTLAGGIAHDFNNILYPIIGFAQMAMTDLEDSHPVRENIEDILKGAERARDLVKQILSFSAQRDTHKKMILLQPVIKETLGLLRSAIPTTIVIEKQITNEQFYISANETEIHEIIMNLCTNAYHAMEDTGGVLQVSLRKKMPDVRLKPVFDDYCCLEVSDTGTGIPSAVMDKIFDPYFTTKAPGKGSGLGLSVIHGIIKSYDGIIDIQSQAPKGTRVRVYLPVALEPGEKQDEIQTRYRSGHERILLVDDEEAIVKLVSRLLQRLGYQVTSRTSSLEALELFRSSPEAFDLVITDMTMPELVGTRLAQAILMIRPGMPIMICTGFSEQLDDSKAAALGIRGFIHKPVLMTELSEKIRDILDTGSGP